MLNEPPVGKCVIKVGTPHDVKEAVTALLTWEPGNATSYQVVVNRLPEYIAEVLGGEMLISVRVSGGTTYVSYVVTLHGMLHETLVREKFGKQITSEQDIVMLTCLLNWSLYDSDTCHDYAQELWDEGEERWKIVRKT